MLWIPILIFVLTLVVVIGVYLLRPSSRAERLEIRKRLSLLEMRSLEGPDLPDVIKREMLSDIPLLDRLLSRVPVAVRIDRKLRQAGMKLKVGAFLLLSAVLFCTGLAAGTILHWPRIVSLIVGALLSVVPNIVANVKKRLRLAKFMSHFPDALEMFARSLRAGHSFTGAIQLVAQEMPQPIGPEFQRVFDEQNLGIPLRHALVGMTDRVDSLDVKFFVTAILIQRDTGGNLAEIIDKISYVIRERFRIQGQLRIYTAQGRLTGIILGALPVAMALVIGTLNPEYLKPLWFDRTGRFLLATAVVLQVAGVLAIRRIIRIKI